MDLLGLQSPPSHFIIAQDFDVALNDAWRSPLGARPCSLSFLHGNHNMHCWSITAVRNVPFSVDGLLSAVKQNASSFSKLAELPRGTARPA